MTILSRFFLCCLVGSMTATCCADDWSQFRGPTGQGLATGQKPPIHWNDVENVVWKQELPGQGWSSPILHQGKIYITAATPLSEDEARDYSLRVLRLDAEDGRVLSSTEVFQQDGKTAAKIHSKNSHASPTPLIDQDQLFVHFGHQGTACLDLNGEIRWKRSLEYKPVHGNGGTPIVAGNALIFSCDGGSQPFVVALNRHTGDQLWKTPRETEVAKKFSFSTPLLIDVQGSPQVVSPGSNAVCAYDPETGRELWRVRYDGYSVIPRPVYGQGLVFICTGFDTPSLLAIRPDGQGDVTDTHVAWTLEKGIPHTPSLTLVDEELYMVSDRGIASCVAARTGELHWRERIGGNFSCSPIYANGHLYLQDESGVTTIIKAARQYEVVATNRIEQRTLASMAVGGDALYLRGDTHLFRIQNR